MELTAQSTVNQVLIYHPLRGHYDHITMNQDSTWFGAAGPWRHVLGAQDRVILRRHIRKFFPDVARIWKINELDYQQLASLITTGARA